MQGSSPILLSELERILPPALVLVAQVAGQLAKEQGRALCIVGGVVRDYFLRRPSLDLDLMVQPLNENSCPSEDPFIQTLNRRLKGRLTTHDVFLTAQILLSDGWTIDVAYARTERYARAGALPEVSPGTFERDLSRRDFSINAMAFRVCDGQQCTLFDPLGGLSALRSGQLKILHDRSFVDDPTRLFRGIRFAARLDFDFDAQTKKLALEALQGGALASISDDRIARELNYIFSEPHIARAFVQFLSLDLLPGLFLGGLKSTAVVRAELMSEGLEARERTEAVVLAFLSYLPGPQQGHFLNKMGIRGERRRSLIRDIQIAEALKSANLSTEPWPISGWIECIKPLSAVGVRLCRHLLASGKSLKEFELAYSKRELKAPINGRDLMSLGMSPGPDIAKVLSRVQKAFWDGEFSSRDDALRAVRDWQEDAR